MGVEAVTTQRVALLAGGSGFVGSRLLRLLLHAPDYSRVHAVSRRPLSIDHARLANRIMPLEETRAQLGAVRCQEAFCCIGSTRLKAGSPAERQKIDLDMVVSFARAAQALGAKRFVVISSAGADTRSGNDYLRVKGQLEAALRDLRFPALDILQPGLLLGSRKDFRPLELAGTLLMPLANPFLRGRYEMWRGISADDTAYAMLGAARSQRGGVHIYSGAALAALAESGRKPPF
jgi:uncharacterized protein YbjT (DUF2867 family)